MAMAGSTAVQSLASDDILGMNSSGSSGGSAATVSMALSASNRRKAGLASSLGNDFSSKILEGCGARVVIKLCMFGARRSSLRMRIK